MKLPCKLCGSLTDADPKRSLSDPLLCHHCKQSAPSGAAATPAKKPRKRTKRSRLAPAETY